MRQTVKKTIAAFLLVVTTTGGLVAQAQEKTASKATKKKSTDVSFDEVLVEGKYHFADEAVTTVEGDKVVDALLNVRTDFKDRIKKSNSRH